MDVHKNGKRKFSEDQRQECTKSKKKKSKRKKKPSKYKKYSDSSETSTESDSSTSTSSLEDYKRKHKSSKRVSKHKKSKHESFNKSSKKKKHKRKHKEEKFRPIDKIVCKDAPKAAVNSDIGPMPEANKSMAPMTKEEWEKQQNVVRRVYDPETGRNRLVKGDGEILEEIVSRERHKEINKMATFNDGEYFRAKMGL